MSLEMKKSSTLTGESRINNQIVMTMTAEIPSNALGNSFVRTAITDQELYAKNRAECRKDVSDFQDRVYLIEDKFIDEGFEGGLATEE